MGPNARLRCFLGARTTQIDAPASEMILSHTYHRTARYNWLVREIPYGDERIFVRGRRWSDCSRTVNHGDVVDAYANGEYPQLTNSISP